MTIEEILEKLVFLEESLRYPDGGSGHYIDGYLDGLNLGREIAADYLKDIIEEIKGENNGTGRI